MMSVGAREAVDGVEVVPQGILVVLRDQRRDNSAFATQACGVLVAEEQVVRGDLAGDLEAALLGVHDQFHLLAASPLTRRMLKMAVLDVFRSA